MPYTTPRPQPEEAPTTIEPEDLMFIPTSAAPTTATDLSLPRLNLMRAGYLLMGADSPSLSGRSFRTLKRCRSTRA